MNALVFTFTILFTGINTAPSMSVLTYDDVIESAEVLIAEDYQSLLNGLNELRDESKQVKSSAERRAISAAMDDLVSEFTSGTYAIFHKNATISQGASSRPLSTRQFLNSYPGKNFRAARIHVVDTRISADRRRVEVTFEATGETSSGTALRLAEVSISAQGKPLITRIRHLNSTSKETVSVQKPNLSESTPSPTQAINPPEEEVQLPEIEVVDILKSNSGRVRLQGKVHRPAENARLLASLDGTNLDKGDIMLNGDRFTLQPSMALTNDFEIELTYHFGDKFISVRKHVIIASK